MFAYYHNLFVFDPSYARKKKNVPSRLFCHQQPHDYAEAAAARHDADDDVATTSTFSHYYHEMTDAGFADDAHAQLRRCYCHALLHHRLAVDGEEVPSLDGNL